MEYTYNMTSVSMDELKQYIINTNGYIRKVYLHWSAGRYHQAFDDYHINIDSDGKVYMFDSDLTIKRNHTYMRNSRSVGIALCCAYGAVCNSGYDADMGDYDVTSEQIETMAYIIALFVRYGGISINDVMTHCEAAFEDGYGPYQGDPDLRWDLWWLYDNADGRMKLGGNVLRGKAEWYLSNYNV